MFSAWPLMASSIELSTISQRRWWYPSAPVPPPIHASNVMLVDPQTKKGTRVGYRLNDVERDGVKRTVRVRVAKRSGKDV